MTILMIWVLYEDGHLSLFDAWDLDTIQENREGWLAKVREAAGVCADGTTQYRICEVVVDDVIGAFVNHKLSVR